MAASIWFSRIVTPLLKSASPARSIGGVTTAAEAGMTIIPDYSGTTIGGNVMLGFNSGENLYHEQDRSPFPKSGVDEEGFHPTGRGGGGRLGVFATDGQRRADCA